MTQSCLRRRSQQLRDRQQQQRPDRHVAASNPGTCPASPAPAASRVPRPGNANCPATGTGTCSLSGLPCTANNCPTVSGTCNANSATRAPACTANSRCRRSCRRPADQDVHGEQPVHAGAAPAAPPPATPARPARPIRIARPSPAPATPMRRTRERAAPRTRTAPKRPACAASPGPTLRQQRLQGRLAAHFRGLQHRWRERRRGDADRRRQRRRPHLPPQQQGLHRRERRAQRLPGCDVQHVPVTNIPPATRRSGWGNPRGRAATKLVPATTGSQRQVVRQGDRNRHR